MTTSKFKQNGYVITIDHGHPLADFRGRVPQHRKIMFDIFGWGPLKCYFCDLVLPFRTGRKQAGQENWGIEIDHIDADRTNNDFMNLAPVCPSHQTRRGMRGAHEIMYLTQTEDWNLRLEVEQFKMTHPDLFAQSQKVKA